MATSIEIEVESESESCDCCADCKMGSGMAAKPAKSKDELLAELKKLLMMTGTNGLAERQMKIDELISEIEDLGD
jgi:hypothetical protein